MSNRRKFARLVGARRVWAVSGIHGEADRLERLHAGLWRRLAPGDRIVYLGNMVGRGAAVRETIDGLLAFRRVYLSQRNAFTCDLVYLRGAQEEMWQKLLQLQFAKDPHIVLTWMLEQGIEPLIEAYGSNERRARQVATGGTVMMTRWTSELRAAMRAKAGHFPFFSAFRRAALTEEETLLFVNAGLDPSRPLDGQFDSFWWGGGSFGQITEPYGSFRKVVRGFDPSHPGLAETDYTLTVDGGCGFGGPLLAVCLEPEGRVVDLIEA